MPRHSGAPGLFSSQMKFLLSLLLMSPLLAFGAGHAYDCAGKTRFVHRGAPSTVPADDKRSYRIHADQMDGLDCKLTDTQIACMGLTPQQAMRKVVIDRTAPSVSDTMELPTSMLIFEGQCTPAD